MGKLSDKELLNILADFPKHELTTMQRTEMLSRMREEAAKKSKIWVNVRKITALAFVFILFMIAPIIFLIIKNDDSSQTGHITKEVSEGVYFALEDEQGKPIYEDSNFGIPNKVSLLAPHEWVAYDLRSTSKIMIFLWGKDLDLHQMVSIDATHVETGIKEHVTNTQLSGGINGADAHALVDFSFAFEKRGKWNLDFTLLNPSGKKKEVGTFSIYVKAPYVMVGRSATLLISEEDLTAGFYKDANIEVMGDQLPENLDLEIISEDDHADKSVFTFKKSSDFTTTEGDKVSVYEGDFQIKKSGKYTFGVLGTSNLVNVNNSENDKK